MLDITVKTGSAFVEFENKVDAEDVIYAFHAAKFLGRRLDIGWIFFKKKNNYIKLTLDLSLNTMRIIVVLNLWNVSHNILLYILIVSYSKNTNRIIVNNMPSKTTWQVNQLYLSLCCSQAVYFPFYFFFSLLHLSPA